MFGAEISKGYLVQLDPDSHAYQFIKRGQEILETTGASKTVDSVARSAKRHQDEVEKEQYVDFEEGTVGIGLTWDPHEGTDMVTIVYQAVRVEALPFLQQIRVRGRETTVFDTTQQVDKGSLQRAIKEAYRKPEQFVFDAGGYGGGY